MASFLDRWMNDRALEEQCERLHNAQPDPNWDKPCPPAYVSREAIFVKTELSGPQISFDGKVWYNMESDRDRDAWKFDARQFDDRGERIGG